ncbi:anti-sigma factor [Actinocrispum wychmicini]|uniref:Regulator of SigK n=1 Tax=Actinocrispum wychmicini TaxID=1213861 RepID=A0A4R2JCQ0_9PSEU|nr:anti-sigma factor [Actinocrispum wychmicini]TCO57353.1 anti-sigma-K factor RskA [Actinocrispum wychmicini]
MSSGLNNDVHTLTGAYVLDALSEVERRAFEDHMAGCTACSQEVAELRETTARLGLATATTPPPHLWNRVRTAATQVRQLPPLSSDSVVLKSNRWPTRLAVFAAAASLVVAAGLGVGWITSNDRLEDQLAQSQNQLDKLQSVLSAPDAQVSTGTVEGGNVTAVISRSRNGMVVLVHGLPALPANRVYQAWFTKPNGTVASAGILATSTGSLTADDLASGQGASGLAFTVEPMGGSSTPTKPILGPVTIRI